MVALAYTVAFEGVEARIVEVQCALAPIGAAKLEKILRRFLQKIPCLKRANLRPARQYKPNL